GQNDRSCWCGSGCRLVDCYILHVFDSPDRGFDVTKLLYSSFRYTVASTVSSLAACFFLYSSIPPLIPSSASTEQWIFTGGRFRSLTICVFLMFSASSIVFPLISSVA